MGFLSFSLNYYKNKISQYEIATLSQSDIYEAKQLLKMLDDLVDEGYHELFIQVEEKFHGVTRLKEILSKHQESPFPVIKFDKEDKEYCTVVQKLEDCISELVNKASEDGPISDNVILEDIVQFCKWIGFDKDTAYVFLLRDTLLPYIYFTKETSSALYPWIIGRSYMKFLSSKNSVDDIIRASFFDALEAGCEEFSEFKEFCKKKVLVDLENYQEVVSALRELLGTIQKEKILVIESGCYGTFPMLLSVLDERVDFKMFTTVPFLTSIYQERIFTKAYEKNRLFETLYSQDKLFTFESFQNGAFYISKKVDEHILKEAIGEVRSILHYRTE